MKKTYAMTILLLAGLLALAACGKSKVPPGPSVNGVTIDMIKFQQVFAASGLQFDSSVNAVRMGVRYGDYGAALAELEKMAANPSLTETQKQVVALVTDQIKQAASKPQAPAPQ